MNPPSPHVVSLGNWGLPPTPLRCTHTHKKDIRAAASQSSPPLCRQEVTKECARDLSTSASTRVCAPSHHPRTSIRAHPQSADDPLPSLSYHHHHHRLVQFYLNCTEARRESLHDLALTAKALLLSLLTIWAREICFAVLQRESKWHGWWASFFFQTKFEQSWEIIFI